MDSMYVALSAQVALEQKLDTIAQNVANLGTVGYRADEIKFEEELAKAGSESSPFVSAGDVYISRQPGALTKTDNALCTLPKADAVCATPPSWIFPAK